MKSEDIDWDNPYEVWEYLMQPVIDREPNEIDEHYRERILKYMKDKPMSEEIIKDCENYHKGWCLLSKTSYGNVTEFCNEKKDCTYKQLKRMQAENEQLKKRQITKNGFICDCEKNVKYRQALEEIMEYLQQFKKKKSNFYTLNDVVTDIANNIEKIISEDLLQ